MFVCGMQKLIDIWFQFRSPACSSPRKQHKVLRREGMIGECITTAEAGDLKHHGDAGVE